MVLVAADKQYCSRGTAALLLPAARVTIPVHQAAHQRGRYPSSMVLVVAESQNCWQGTAAPLCCSLLRCFLQPESWYRPTRGVTTEAASRLRFRLQPSSMVLVAE